ncbi:MAG: GNAT family N-acetyltransferase [Planctomycetes bacterium]|nr:GNAT family N-acetyltransferase [Planctomycetota bacterium]
MKPLVIIPPSPARWHSLLALVGHKGPLWLEDIEKRFVQGVPGSQDAFAVIANGGQFLAHACINKKAKIGILGNVHTRSDHRGRGYARLVIKAMLAWFDMVGGKWLYLGTTADLADGLFGKFGFKVIRRSPREPHDGITMLRTVADVGYDPLGRSDAAATTRPISRADWPLIVALLQHRAGPDPRLALDESAVSAELTALELISQHEQGTCHVMGTFCADRALGVGSVAADRIGQRTYAILMPHGTELPELREAITAHARSQGYTQVDFPMETLADGECPASPTPG